ncbi:UNVERIFIED_CONTAM: Transcription factor MYBC1 [Sesamum radiatum]|uniref:Transcription factor MYBC1 n=1 Tax=Sesamum radiatum TaxID=300843 RepID=A0AAW2LG81_SESRA
MREEDSNWFSKWEEELPSPEELMPLSQSLITPDLAIAFNIPSPQQALSTAATSASASAAIYCPLLPTQFLR